MKRRYVPRSPASYWLATCCLVLLCLPGTVAASSAPAIEYAGPTVWYASGTQRFTVPPGEHRLFALPIDVRSIPENESTEMKPCFPPIAVFEIRHVAPFIRIVRRVVRGVVPLLFASVSLVTSAFAQGSDPCDGAYSPDSVEVAVTSVPIEVTSTAADYFVLYVKHDVDGTDVELPVLVKLGEAGTTTLKENVQAQPMERYRVEKYLVADPADVDGDCIDDITELAAPDSLNPLNAAAGIPIDDGAVVISDRNTFERLAFRERLTWYLKFVIPDLNTTRPAVYFINTNTFSAHARFLDAVGLQLGQDGMFSGEIAYDPDLVAPDGNRGVYRYRLYQKSSYHQFDIGARSYTVLSANMPLLNDNLALHLPNYALTFSQSALPLYRGSRINLVFDDDIYTETGFLALNPGEGFGLLRVIRPDERPHPRDIVLYEALPNELPRVAGIISTVPQTPLSHVNLRAVQDGIPNAFIRDALDKTEINAHLGGYVRFEVNEDGWSLRSATRTEADEHYADSRPARAQTPQRDLSVRKIAPLSDIGFSDWKAFGVKAANVAVLGTLGFPTGTVPDGFAIPFYFYDEFMKAHGFYDRIRTMLAGADFQSDFDVQSDSLNAMRKAIRNAAAPQWMIDSLAVMHATYPEGQSLRYRSSTNNEDLSGFNGAGLYESKTQYVHETEEDGIAKSLKQVFAGMWNFRAFVERDFHRIDHLEAAMGVLVHPNYKDERANGVAVSFNLIDGN